MKFIWLMLVVAAGAWAQNPNQILPTPVDPTGQRCNSNRIAEKTPDGKIYTCQFGMMAQIGGGAGGMVKTCTLAAATSCTIANPPTDAVYGFTDSSGNWSGVEAKSITGANTALATITFDVAVTGTVGAVGSGATGAAGAAGAPGAAGSGNNAVCLDATGSTTAYTCPTPSPTVTTLVGLQVAFVPQATNGAAPALTVAGLGSKALKQADCSTNIASSALTGGTMYLFAYNGTNFCQTGGGGAGSISLVQQPNGGFVFINPSGPTFQITHDYTAVSTNPLGQGQFQSGTSPNICTQQAGSTSTAYILFCSTTLTALAANQWMLLVVTTTSGASPTGNIDTLGTKPMVDSTGAAITAGEFVAGEYLVYYNGTSLVFMTVGVPIGAAPLASPTFIGTVTVPKVTTIANCSSSASPAVCAAAAAGSIAFPTGVTSVVLQVNTTAVTANSQIFVFPDDTLGTKLAVTCNSTLATLVGGMAITARTAGSSFTVTFNGTITANPLCANFLVVN